MSIKCITMKIHSNTLGLLVSIKKIGHQYKRKEESRKLSLLLMHHSYQHFRIVVRSFIDSVRNNLVYHRDRLRHVI
jgi:hypothetical protein